MVRGEGSSGVSAKSYLSSVGGNRVILFFMTTQTGGGVKYCGRGRVKNSIRIKRWGSKIKRGPIIRLIWFHLWIYAKLLYKCYVSKIFLCRVDFLCVKGSCNPPNLPPQNNLYFLLQIIRSGIYYFCILAYVHIFWNTITQGNTVDHNLYLSGYYYSLDWVTYIWGPVSTHISSPFI